jgi:hypothetical protein
MGKLKSQKESTEVIESQQNDSVDRIILKREERNKLDQWLGQLNAKYDSMVKFSKIDLANFLIRHSDDELSESQIKLLGAELYDEMRWINRAIEKVRQAKREGLSLSLEDLMTKRKPIEKMKASLKKRDSNKRKPGANDESFIVDQVEATADKSSES